MDRGEIARIALANDGVLTSDDLARLGVSAKVAQRCVRTGEWRRVDSGVYVVAAVAPTFAQGARAVVAAMPDATLGWHTAGEIHGCGVHDDVVHALVPPNTRNRLTGAVLHQVELPRTHVTRRQGFPVTTIERTVIDLAAALSSSELQRCIEDVLVAGRTTMARLETTFRETARRGRPGIARARAVLDRIDGQPPTESELEAMFIRLIERHRLPLPTRQVRFEWAEGEQGRVDFAYLDHRLIVELDGRPFHLRVAAFERDHRRRALAVAAGFETVPFTHLQVSTDPQFVVGIMRDLLRSRGAG